MLAVLWLGCADDPCADAPVVTWDNFGQGFLIENCQGCHAGALTAEQRQGAPSDVVFDTEADVALLTERILAVAAADGPTMPPMGGVTDDDRALLDVWLTCYAP